MIQDNQLMNIRNGIVLDALICVKIAITPFKKKNRGSIIHLIHII